jgi:Flp pilus assembly protein TadB
VTTAALLAGLTVLLLVSTPPELARRTPTGMRVRRPEPATARSSAVAIAAAATWLLVGGPVGVAGGLTVAVALPRWLRTLPSRAAAERDRGLRSAAPLAAELLAACLAAGASPGPAVRAVGRAVGGDLGDVLDTAARGWALTGSLAAAFTGVRECAVGAPLHDVATACSRAERGGGSAVALLTATASELRDARRTDLDAAARRAGAFAVAPLGLCFLPAFVLIGIVPLVAGLLSEALPGY